MAKKEINVFSVSFLDLLAGALAAVIILFVIVPKLTAEDQSVIDTVDSLEVSVNELDSLVQLAQNSVPDSLYQQIQQEIENMRNNMDSLRSHAQNLEQQLENTQQRNRTLENQLVETEQRLQEIEQALQEAQDRPTREEIEQIREQLAEAIAELEEQREQAAQGAGGPGASMFGLNAKFAVICTWNENLDVDLYMKNIATGEWISYSNKEYSWGNYLGDVTSRTEGDDRFEMIYQQLEIIPGNYEVWYHLYSNSGTAHIDGYAVIHPFTSREKKIKFNNQTLNHTSKPTSGGGIKLGTLKVTENNIILN